MNTTIMCDSLQAVCSGRMADVCLSRVNQSGTNWQTVIIFVIIFSSILAFALVWICKYYNWKKREQDDQIKANEKRREQEKEDREYKRQTELQEKLLKHMESQVFKTKYIEIEKDKKYREEKELDPKASQTYKDLLDTLIKNRS